MRTLFLASFGGSLNLVDDIRGSWAGRQEATSSRQPFFLSFQRPFWCISTLLFPVEVIHLVYKKRPQPHKLNSTFQNSYWQKRCKKKPLLLLVFEGQNTCLLLLVRPSYSSFCCYGQWLLEAATLEQEAARLRINEEVVEAAETGKRPVATFFLILSAIPLPLTIRAAATKLWTTPLLLGKKELGRILALIFVDAAPYKNRIKDWKDT